MGKEFQTQILMLSFIETYENTIFIEIFVHYRDVIFFINILVLRLLSFFVFVLVIKGEEVLRFL